MHQNSAKALTEKSLFLSEEIKKQFVKFESETEWYEDMSAKRLTGQLLLDATHLPRLGMKRVAWVCCEY